MQDREKAALVLFSGGQDSTTCLAWALEHYEHVETIGFDYGSAIASRWTAGPLILAGAAQPLSPLGPGAGRGPWS